MTDLTGAYRDLTQAVQTFISLNNDTDTQAVAWVLVAETLNRHLINNDETGIEIVPADDQSPILSLGLLTVGSQQIIKAMEDR